MEWTAGESLTVNRDNKSTSVFITGKEDQKLVPIKREEIVTGAETTSTPNPRKDESSVDMDNYVGVFVTRDIEPVQTMEWTAEDSVTISEYNKSASSVFVTGREDQKLFPIKREEIVTGIENTSTAPNPRRDKTSVDRGKCFGDL